MRNRIIGVAMALAVFAMACGKSSSTLPVSPSPSPGSAPSGGALGGTASISGTVLPGSSGSSLRPAGSPINVTVVGTSISTTVDGSGHFTLQNLPPGDLTIAFSGNGHEARIVITEVTDREEIHITVNLGGSSADIDEDERETPDNRAQLEGRIVSINCGATPPTMVVGHLTQITVLMPPGTPIRHGGDSLTCSQLTVGLRVHVKGTKSGTTITASEVIVQQGAPGPPEPANEVELKGTISALTPGCPSVSFMVSSTKVVTNPNTKFDETPCGALHNGSSVEVEGTRQADGSVLARKIDSEDDGDRDRDGNQAEVQGTVSGAAAGHACPTFAFMVGSTKVAANASTKFEDTSCAGVINGIVVDVKGTRQADGSIVATQVEKKK